MQVNNFIQYLDDFEQLKTVSEDEMVPIIQEYPYCQTGQLMYAIQLNAINSILFDEQLKRTVSICSDRNKLFEYINISEELVIQERKDVVEIVVEPSIPDVILEEVIETEVEITEVENDKKVRKSILEKFVPIHGEDEFASLEKEYLTEAINSSILIEPEDSIDNVEVPGSVVVGNSIDFFDEGVSHSFGSWLKHYNGEEEVVALKVESVKSKDIIDKFIQEDPRIKPEKSKFYSPTNMARLSVTDDGIVSETLAIILAKQSNYKGAINTYEKLMLKSPKKRSYFVSQIKILKQKIK